ncbi:MAG: [acyl-carrier-protein] S-malonyltransferase [Oscillospiraceae bacterium]|nr:[acyl-carrier-protein] S-malonyltransferase [Oscillospiraceae bacterium]
MGKIAFVFPGQGAQYPGMGESLTGYPEAKAVFELADALRPGTSVQCFYGTKEELTITEHTQPCMFAVELAAAEALKAAGVVPDAVAGFSLGEVTALTFAGAFSHQDGFSLVCRRGELMQRAAQENPGKMAAVLKLESEAVEKLCADIGGCWPVNYNCPGQVSVAGLAASIDALIPAVKAAGGRATPLAVSGGFHSPLMDEAADALLPLIEERAPKLPAITTYANATGAAYGSDGETLPVLLSRQVKSPVQWQRTIERMTADGVDTFIEAGPGKVLSGLISRIAPSARVFLCDTLEQVDQIAEQLKQSSFGGIPLC